MGVPHFLFCFFMPVLMYFHLSSFNFSIQHRNRGVSGTAVLPKMQKGDRMFCLFMVSLFNLLSCVVPTQVCAEPPCKVKGNMQH